MQNQNVLISGAGVAGPALAYWLRRRGFTPTVVERAPAPRPGGQTVDLRGAGRTVVERMNLMDRMRAVSVEQRGMAMIDGRGRVRARMPAELFGGEGIISEIELLRGDLADVLYEATVPGVEYLFDDTATGLEQDETGVSVTFERSAPRRFDLVVGADGLHSAVRSLAFGPEAGAVRSLGLYGAIFTAAADIELNGWYLMYNAPGGRVASVRPGRLAGEMKVALNFRSGPIDYDRRDVAQQRDIVARHLAGAGWEVPRLLEAMDRAPDFFFDSTGQVHMDRWSAGRVVLLGDAGYCPSPLTGLGTSLALVGAYLLAGELAAAGGDHRRAFSRYEELMRPYVSRAQELPPGGVGGFAPHSALTIRLRTASMRWMTRRPFGALIAGQFAKAESIDLPDYGDGHPASRNGELAGRRAS